MPVAISIYSEGQTASLQKNDENDIGHDVSKMNRLFIDADGTPNSLEYVTGLFRDNTRDNHTLFQNGLRVSLRIPENTMLSLHEMIASDVFIGSGSSMSSAIVGSLGRSAFFVLPTKDEYFSYTHVEFNSTTGEISRSEMRRARMMWRDFLRANKETVSAAISNRSDRLKT